MTQQVSSPQSSNVANVAKDVMSPEAVPLKPGKFPRDLVIQFLSGQYDGWPVVDSNNKVIGVLRESRLLQALSFVNSWDDLQVDSMMTTPPFYVFEDDPLEVVLDLMIQKHVVRMPVVGERYLAGVISRRRVVRQFCGHIGSPRRTVSSCFWCERVQDPIEHDSNNQGWRDLGSFLSGEDVSFAELEIAQTYCSSCLKSLQGFLKGQCHLPGMDENLSSSSPCVLVVDDDIAVSKMLGEALKEWGYEACLVNNGRDALKVVHSRQVDGILLDLDMPVMNGRTMLDELRWLGYEVPVVMMSGGSDHKELRRFLQEGAQGYLMKPFNLQALKQICQQIFVIKPVEKRAKYHLLETG